jgi:kinesin family member 12
MLSEY